MAADSDDGSGPPIRTEDVRRLGPNCSDDGSRLDNVRKETIQVKTDLRAQALQQGKGPGPAACINQSGGRCIGHLGDPLAGEEAGEKIR